MGPHELRGDLAAPLLLQPQMHDLRHVIRSFCPPLQGLTAVKARLIPAHSQRHPREFPDRQRQSNYGQAISNQHLREQVLVSAASSTFLQ